MRKWLLMVVMLASGVSFAKYSISAGGSVLGGFGIPKAWYGIQLGMEIPQDDSRSLYGRLTHHFGKTAEDSDSSYATAIDPTTSPYTKLIMFVPKMDYTILEGGMRYYLGDGYDSGLSLYGGSLFSLIYSRVRMKYSDFDQSLYELDPNTSFTGGSIFGLSFGFDGGLKYSIDNIGTFYFDVSVGYVILAQRSQNTVYSDLFRPLLFAANLGYRYDIIW